MKQHEQSSDSMKGFVWVIIGFHEEASRGSIGFHEYVSDFMNNHRIPWRSIGFHRIFPASSVSSVVVRWSQTEQTSASSSPPSEKNKTWQGILLGLETDDLILNTNSPLYTNSSTLRSRFLLRILFWVLSILLFFVSCLALCVLLGPIFDKPSGRIHRAILPFLVPKYGTRNGRIRGEWRIGTEHEWHPATLQ